MKTQLKLDRETKGIYVFKNDEDGAPIPSLYVKKSAFKDKAPEILNVEFK